MASDSSCARLPGRWVDVDRLSAREAAAVGLLDRAAKRKPVLTPHHGAGRRRQRLRRRRAWQTPNDVRVSACFGHQVRGAVELSLDDRLDQVGRLQVGSAGVGEHEVCGAADLLPQDRGGRGEGECQRTRSGDGPVAVNAEQVLAERLDRHLAAEADLAIHRRQRDEGIAVDRAAYRGDADAVRSRDAATELQCARGGGRVPLGAETQPGQGGRQRQADALLRRDLRRGGVKPGKNPPTVSTVAG